MARKLVAIGGLEFYYELVGKHSLFWLATLIADILNRPRRPPNTRSNAQPLALWLRYSECKSPLWTIHLKGTI